MHDFLGYCGAVSIGDTFSQVKEAGRKALIENEEGITESCPMWQQQNKDKK
jgi:hypothetical protein